MLPLHKVRQGYGGIFATVFSEDLIVPWKPLSLGDFISYTRDYERGAIPSVLLEDEVFKKCVLDSSLVRQMNFLPAGLVSVVAQNIWEYSGPKGVSEFNQDLAGARHILFGGGSKALHELVTIIAMAFPYKPEEVYAMDYETFLLRLAQSEKKLIDMGVLKTSVDLIEEQVETPTPKKAKAFADLNKVDIKKLWEEQHGIVKEPLPPPPVREKAPPPAPPGPSQRDNKRWWKVSPVLEAQKSHGINFGADNASVENTVLDNHEMSEAPEVREYLINEKTRDSRQKLIQDAQWIYKDLLEGLAKKKPS